MLRDRVVMLEHRVRILIAVLRLVIAMLRVSGFQLDLQRVRAASSSGGKDLQNVLIRPEL